MNHPNVEIMQKAINLAREKYLDGGHAVASIIVQGDEIIAEAYTTVTKEQDPTNHAEINAIREASKKLKTQNLADCYLYSTYEPCPMCASAIVYAKIKGIIYGANMNDETTKYPQRIKIRCYEIINKAERKIELYPDFMREQCIELLKL